MATLTNKKIAVLVSDGFEDSEFTQPVEAVMQAGGEVFVVSPEKDQVTGKNGETVPVDVSVDAASAEVFDGLILPGGLKNPDTLRQNKQAVSFVRDFFAEHKPVAAICHAPWLLIEAGVVDGRTLTSYPSLKTDLENAGAHWVDEPVVTDEGLVTSRTPDDLPEFCAKAVEEFGEGEHEEQTT